MADRSLYLEGSCSLHIIRRMHSGINMEDFVEGLIGEVKEEIGQKKKK